MEGAGEALIALDGSICVESALFTLRVTFNAFRLRVLQVAVDA